MMKVTTVRDTHVLGEGDPAVIDQVGFLQWLEALESGKYMQTQRQLQDDFGFCCLGVACMILPFAKTISDGSTPSFKEGHLFGGYPTSQENAPRWLKYITADLGAKTGQGVANLNDTYHWTFKQIASVLRRVYVEGEDLTWCAEKLDFVKRV